MELARQKGFDVTEDELAEASRAVRDAPYGTLDDEALEVVVGGGDDFFFGHGTINVTFT